MNKPVAAHEIIKGQEHWINKGDVRLFLWEKQAAPGTDKKGTVLFAQRHPDRVKRLALDAFVWTGQGSPTLAERTKKLPEFKTKNRRPIDRAFVHSIFERDHPGTADKDVVEAFADQILALDDSV